jgi:hypothetical protein
MKAADSYKTLETIGQNNWCPNSGALSLNLHHHESAKKHRKMQQLIKNICST